MIFPTENNYAWDIREVPFQKKDLYEYTKQSRDVRKIMNMQWTNTLRQTEGNSLYSKEIVAHWETIDDTQSYSRANITGSEILAETDQKQMHQQSWACWPPISYYQRWSTYW